MKKTKHKNFIIVFLIGVFLIFFCLWQNNDIVVSDYIYKSKKISRYLDGFKIVQISDLHNKKFGKNQKNLLKILENEAPNIIVITGDIVDSNHTNIEIALEFIRGAVEIAPVYYVTGNHEYWLNSIDSTKLMQGMEQSGVIILDNKAISIGKESDYGFYLIGLNDNNLTDSTLKTLCSTLDSNKLQILLAHEPQNIDHYSDAEVDLVFAGHAHGGQWRLPLIGGLYAPNQGLFPQYTSGVHIEDNTTMIVSRGLGNSVIPIRIFNRPQVVVVQLQKE
jgi:predicted MPP superfamily phosphohydrolase